MKTSRPLASSLFVFAVAVILAPFLTPARKPATADLLVLNNVTVVEVRTGTLQRDQTVIMKSDRIYCMEPSNSAKYPRHAESVNCRGMYLIPGVWEIHV